MPVFDPVINQFWNQFWNQDCLSEIRSVEFLGGAGGFSGAQFWRIDTPSGDYCLRRWPPAHPSPKQLDWFNLVLIHAFNNGCPWVPVPLETRTGSRFVDHDNSLWEIAPWMPGEADFESDPSKQRLENAIRCLARFHLASAQVNLDFRKSENVMARLEQLKTADSLIDQISRAGVNAERGSIHHLGRIVLAGGKRRAQDLAVMIEPFARETFPVQPVIRDVWHDHILFTGDDVSGIVDFGAMQMDHIALDISRMLGSLVGGQVVGGPVIAIRGQGIEGRDPVCQTDLWKAGLEAYSTIRPLRPQEIELIPILDQCATLLGSLNWLKWILIERREFESSVHVEKRIRHLIARQI